jgi:hypothetical protein
MNDFYLQTKPISPSETQLEKHKAILAFSTVPGNGSGFTGYSYKSELNNPFGGTASAYFRFNNSTSADTFIIVPMQFYSVPGVSGCTVHLLK